MPTYKKTPVVCVEQLIRAPQAAVFSAFVEPQQLKKFWLSKSSGRLEVGKTVRWHFKVKGANDTVKVLDLEPAKRIRLQWSDQTITEWTFATLGRNRTLVRIEQWGFTGPGDDIIAIALETTQGFAWVLSDLKVLLERQIKSDIVKDKAVVIERAMRDPARKKK